MTANEAVKGLVRAIDSPHIGNPFTTGGTFKQCKVDIALPGFEMVAKDGSVFQVIVIEKHAVKIC